MIKWVITVPAIWRDVSKRFMREAAFKVNKYNLSVRNSYIINVS